MKDLAAVLCVIAVIISLIAFASMCIAIMLWLIGLFGVGFEAVCRSFSMMVISGGVAAASCAVIGCDA
jgi:hypothetical protein